MNFLKTDTLFQETKRRSFMIPYIQPYFGAEERKAVFQYMAEGTTLAEGEKTIVFEKMICNFTGARYCVLTHNGTESITLALLAMGLKAGDEILIPDFTFVSCASAPLLIGVTPRFVDIDQTTLCLDLNDAAKKITKYTKALMYVSLNGRTHDMRTVAKFCKTHNILLLEDAAQGFGSFSRDKHLGTYGVCGTFSFSFTKMISTGQGGAVITNSKRVYHRLSYMKNFGRTGPSRHIFHEIGWHFKFTDLQAVIGIEQMKKLRAILQRKREIYQRYVSQLQDVIAHIPTDLKNTTPLWTDICVPTPQKLAVHLAENGIHTRLFYKPLHRQKAYKTLLKPEGEFPNTNTCSRRGLWLPSSVTLTNADIDYISDRIKKFYK